MLATASATTLQFAMLTTLRALHAPLRSPAGLLRVQAATDKIGRHRCLFSVARGCSVVPPASDFRHPTRSTASLNRRILLAHPLLFPISATVPFVGLRSGGSVNLGGAQIRSYSAWNRDPWRRNDWVSTAKTGALVVLGAGALLASTSFAFGLIITGAAGYGLYSLYQKVFGPFRSRFGSSRDPFGGVDADIERIFGRQRKSQAFDRGSDVDALVQGLPLVVRGLVKTIFSFVGRAMQSSMQRAGELRRRVDELLQSNARVVAALGDNVGVSTPQQWMESTVNGVGRIEAVFPVIGGSYGAAVVTVKASVGKGDELHLSEIKYRNNQTGEVIDLLRDSSTRGPRKTVIDAEYVDVDDSNRQSSRW